MATRETLQVDLVPIRSSDPLSDDWRALQDATAGATPFGNPTFASAVGEALDYQVRACTARRADGTLVALLPCYLRKLGPYERVVVPPFVQYTPLLLRAQPEAHEVHAGTSTPQVLLERLRASFAAVALNLQPELTDLRPATWAGYRVHPLYTYRLPLDATAPLFETWSENVRRQFRRFMADFKVTEELGDSREVIALCAAAYQRHGRPLPVDAGRLDQLVRHLHGRGLVRVFALRSAQDSIEAGVVVLQDGPVAHYWIAGSRPGPAMTVLLGSVLQRLAEGNVALFDFVGANTPSIAEFKRRFGPELVPYYRVEQQRAVGLRLLALLRRRSG